MPELSTTIHLVAAGFAILEENVTFLPHSAIMRFGLPDADNTGGLAATAKRDEPATSRGSLGC
jgi:hypothetical protein